MIKFAITVCLDYHAELERTLPAWIQTLGPRCPVVVVTSPTDQQTIELAFELGAKPYTTSRFHAHGAAFNKGGALCEAWDQMAPFPPNHLRRSSWCCVFDADIVPPADLLHTLATHGLTPGHLYGAPRLQAPTGQPIPDPDHELPGYFWIFHNTDPHIPSPIFTSWRHAGNYDTVFKNNWPPECRHKLPITLQHIGEPGQNWWGKGNSQAMKDMYAKRRELQGTYTHEKLD